MSVHVLIIEGAVQNLAGSASLTISFCENAEIENLFSKLLSLTNLFWGFVKRFPSAML